MHQNTFFSSTIIELLLPKVEKLQKFDLEIKGKGLTISLVQKREANMHKYAENCTPRSSRLFIDLFTTPRRTYVRTDAPRDGRNAVIIALPLGAYAFAHERTLCAPQQRPLVAGGTDAAAAAWRVVCSGFRRYKGIIHLFAADSVSPAAYLWLACVLPLSCFGASGAELKVLYEC